MYEDKKWDIAAQRGVSFVSYDFESIKVIMVNYSEKYNLYKLFELERVRFGLDKDSKLIFIIVKIYKLQHKGGSKSIRYRFRAAFLRSWRTI